MPAVADGGAVIPRSEAVRLARSVPEQAEAERSALAVAEAAQHQDGDSAVLDELADAAGLPRLSAMVNHMASLGVTGREDSLRRKLVDRLKAILTENASWAAQQVEEQAGEMSS